MFGNVIPVIRCPAAVKATLQNSNNPNMYLPIFNFQFSIQLLPYIREGDHRSAVVEDYNPHLATSIVPFLFTMPYSLIAAKRK